MGDYDFSQDPVEAAARKFGAFWEHLKQTYFEATRGERLTVWTNLLLVIVGVTAAVIYFFQLQATRSQLTVMHTLYFAQSERSIQGGLSFSF